MEISASRKVRKVFYFLVITLLVLIIVIEQKRDARRVKEGHLKVWPVNSSEENSDILDTQYVLESNACQSATQRWLGIIIVTSYVGHDDVRAAHRAAASQNELKQFGLLRVFLLAQVPSTERFISQKSITSEQRRFGDLVQGNFIESYRNLTHKHLMGLKWASTRCSESQFIIKIDDDTVYNIYSVYHYLQTIKDIPPTSLLLAGYVFKNLKPIRLKVDKHYVTKEEFSGDTYPTFLSGWLYITNPYTARKLLTETKHHKFFWIDDTFVTGMLAQNLPIRHQDLNEWFSANPDFLQCCVRGMTDYNLQCQFVAGPNGGDSKLLVAFQKAAKKCLETGCRMRSGDKEDLRNTCVTSYKDVLRSNHADAIIRPIRL